MRQYVVSDGFSGTKKFKGDAAGAILFELGLSEGSPVSKRLMERKYRAIKSQELEDAALELARQEKIEILKEIGGKGRPPYFFAKGKAYGN